MRFGLPLMKDVLMSLAKRILILLGLTAAAWAIGEDIKKNIYGLDVTAYIVSNKEMNDVMEIVQYLKEFGLLNEGVSKKN